MAMAKAPKNFLNLIFFLTFIEKGENKLSLENHNHMTQVGK